ncbi:ATP-binding cassette domain-containing protein [Alicyclobacillus suci]|uniref:ATP-binding cassette domain-containing protein n=1 Tax=Alicyclobacillus suci TaxID=2816080 RepID=UPI001A8D5021|nr:ATP-binding cassette domain-containing protein [Alicyclobacillus suci]
MSMLLAIDNLTVGTAPQRRLHGLTACVDKGEFIVVLGHNGAGKSTLLDVLAGVTVPTEGTLTWQRDDSKTAQANNALINRVGYLFQSPETGLFAGTVAEEFALTWSITPRQVHARAAEVQSLLRRVGLDAIELDDIPATWSTGMQRRMAIALVLAEDPQIVLLDEPSAGLDGWSQQQLLQTLQHMRDEGRTVIVATHDTDAFISLATRAWILADGALVYDGALSDLYAQPERLVTHRLGLPPSLRLQVRLVRVGLLDAPAVRDANTLVESLGPHHKPIDEATGATNPTTEIPDNSITKTNEHAGTVLSSHASVSLGYSQKPHGRLKIDSRSRWITVSLVTVAIALVHTPLGIVLGLCGTVALLIAFGASWRRVAKWSIVWGLFALFTTAIGATRVGPPFHPTAHDAFSFVTAGHALVSILPYWCFLQSSQLLVTGTTALEVQAMLEWILRFLHLPAQFRHLASLTGGIVYRFLPAVSQLYQVQLRAYRVRTLATRKRRFASLRLTHVLAPLVIRLIRYGETTHDALMARNLFTHPIPSAQLLPEKLRLRDWMVALIGFAFATAVVGIQWFV